MRWKSGQLALTAIVLAAAATGCKKPVKDTVDGGPDIIPPIVVVDAGHDAGPDPAFTPIVDLRADVNRDGVVSMSDDTDVAGKDAWTAERGAIFIANIDDDTKRCPFAATISDIDLAKCHDAADTIVNGDDDLLDLAFLKTAPWPDARDNAFAQLFVDEKALPYVRLFRKVGGGFEEYLAEDPIFPPQIREGMEFAIEGKDIVRDPAKWDGYVDLRWEIAYRDPENELQRVSDTVRMRVSPVMTFHHLEPAETVYISNYPGSTQSQQFQAAINAAVVAAETPTPLYKYTVGDLWNQDYFETGYMSMPKAGGEQHVIRVNFRSANVTSSNPANPLRPAGRIVYALRGKDTAAVQEYQLNHDGNMDSLNSFGNTETIPPYSHNGVSYPLGRSFRGSVPFFYPDPNFTRMMEAQKVQPHLYVDTSWLLVGHVDETISFLKADSPRGWIMLVNDPAMAKQMLEDQVAAGNGGVQMFIGKTTNGAANGPSATRTINQVLANTEVMNESAKAIVEVDAQVNILKAATGLTDEEIIRIPFLHEPVQGYSVAYQPGTVNFLVVNENTIAPPNPFGPVIDGVDIFQDHMEKALEPYGINIHWIDDWSLYHVNLGEVHCGTNAARRIPAAKWWETGR